MEAHREEFKAHDEDAGVFINASSVQWSKPVRLFGGLVRVELLLLDGGAPGRAASRYSRQENCVRVTEASGEYIVRIICL